MIKETLQTKNKSAGKNTCEYICLHHTWSLDWTIKWVLRQLTVWPVSCHFVIDTNGDIYKIWELTDILWHAGVSEWKGKENMNQYSIGIEIIWPLPWFTNAQRESVKKLVSKLIKDLNLPVDRIIRHKDIAPGRKTDIDDSFWSDLYKTFTDYQKSYMDKTSKFKEVFENEKPKDYKQIFSSLEDSEPATIWDIKYLIEIYNIRHEHKKSS